MVCNLKKHFIILFIFLFFNVFYLCAQAYKIDYYGIVSNEIDTNMAKMTSDLYYTQLNEISNFSINDKRTDSFLSVIPESSIFSENNLSFYTVIIKNQNSDSWTTTYHVVDKKNNEEHIKSKNYDSFYKILMESKNILKDTIKDLIENDVTPHNLINTSVKFESNTRESLKLTSTEILSGTWSGESNINKIVILRGGRGFVIFNNGASMNVTISISEDDNSVIISQNGKANASFYPELPRNVALNAALSATPIQWTLTMFDNNTLVGKKETLIPDSNGNSFIQGTLEVEWHKVN